MKLTAWQHLEAVLSHRPDNTQRVYRAVLEQFCRSLDLTPYSDSSATVLIRATARDAAAFIEWLRARDLSENTVRNRIMVMTGTYNILQRAGFVKLNPFAEFRFIYRRTHKPEHQAPALSDEQVRALCDAPDDRSKAGIRNRAILALLFGCALRRSEVVALRLSDVLVEVDEVLTVLIRHAKGGDNQLVPLPQWVAERVNDVVCQRLSEGAKDEEPLIVNYYHKLNSAITDQTVNRIIQMYARQLGYPDVSSHSGRATAITKLFSTGASLDMVRKFSRHSSYQQVSGYDRRGVKVLHEVCSVLDYEKDVAGNKKKR